ncbi:hypothetical protein NMY22_g5325 [Coprinellus aureogranulatus]|nr:hypothetical protein NMY22_g5325 [Coprinellus aureogranulatus]
MSYEDLDVFLSNQLSQSVPEVPRTQTSAGDDVSEGARDPSISNLAVTSTGNGSPPPVHVDCFTSFDVNRTQVRSENGLLYHSDLDRVGLAINPVHNLYICTSCHTSLTSKGYAGHLKDKEKLSVHASLKAKIDALSAMYDICTNYPKIDMSNGPVPFIAGLEVKLKHGCPLCMYTASHSKVRDHLRDHHKKRDLKPLENVPCQVLNAGGAHSFIRIAPPTPDESESETLEDKFCAFDVNATVTVSAPADKRLISPWLLRTGFHKYVEGHNISELVRLCAMPGDDEGSISVLQDLVLEYMEGATALIDRTDPLVLQLLNTKDAQKDGVNHTPFHEHQEHDTSTKAYSLPVIHLLAAVMRRGSTSLTLPTSQPLDDALTDFNIEPSLITVHSVLLALWAEIWPANIGGNFSDPTICFLALYTLKDDGHFLHPKDVTAILAKLCRMIRLTVLREIHTRVTDRRASTLLEAFQTLAWAVQEGNSSTFHKLMFYQHYASAIAMQTISLPQIVWPFKDEGRYDTMLYRGQLASLKHFLEIITDLETEAMDLWDNRILRGAKLYAPHLVLADNLREVAQGYSLFCEPSNGFSELRHKLGLHLLQAPNFVKHIPGTNRTYLNMAEVREWLNDLARLEAILLLLVEIKSGSPIRMSELCSTLAHNTEFRHRNLMAFGKRVILIRQYTKTTSNRQMDSLIPHLPGAFEADLLIQVHVLARPPAQFFVSQLFPEDRALPRKYQDMLFMDLLKPFDPDKASKMLGEVSCKRLGWKMRIKGYRQMTIGFRNKHNIEAMETDIQDDTMRLIYAQQSGHSLRTENRAYGLSPDLVEGLADATIEIYLKSSVDWQNLLRVIPGTVIRPYSECLAVNRDQLENEGAIVPATRSTVPSDIVTASMLSKVLAELKSHINASQTMLLSQMNQMQSQLALLQSCAPTTTATDSQVMSQPVTSPLHSQSPAFEHKFMQSLTPLPSSKRRYSGSASDGDLSPPAKRMVISKTPSDMRDYLSQLVGRRTNWRNADQRNAVASLLNCKRDIIIVLRTGLGKTAIALLPTMVESGVTVVVVPLVILLEEWESRLRDAGISYEVFLHDRKTPLRTGVRVVLVSSDTARFKSWKEAIATLDNIRPVVRMVVDEAHYYFTDIDFRKNALANPFTLRTLPFQLVLLSATVPPAAESHLKTSFMLHVPHTIRGLSHRKELKYRIFNNASEDTASMVAQFVEYRDKLEKEQAWNQDDRWIVFVPWVSTGHDVAKLLGVEFYHADSEEFPMTRAERRAIYQRFLSGEKHGLVASTALGAGTDYPHIRLTCHLGAMYGMVNFVQQSSRAGRDGRVAHCIVIAGKKAPNVSKGPVADLTGVQPMQDLVYKTTHTNPQKICVRRQIGKTMDGVSYCCFDFDESYQLCGVCEQGAPYTDSVLALYSLPIIVVGVDASFFTGNALTHIDPPPSSPDLPVPASKPLPDLRKEMWETFGDSVRNAAQRAAETFDEKVSALQQYKRVLDTVGKCCGVCWTKRIVSEHNADNCPQLKQKRSEYWAFKKKIKYAGGYRSAPCWKCHICSMGENYLHKDYVRGSTDSCTAPNLLPALLYHLWHDPRMRAKLECDMERSWPTINSWLAWLVEKTEEHSTHPMELVLWFGPIDNLKPGQLLAQEQELIVFKLRADSELSFSKLYRVRVENDATAFDSALNMARTAVQGGTKTSAIEMVLYSPRTVAYVYVQTLERTAILAVLPNLAPSDCIRLPNFERALDETTMYRAFPGSWVLIKTNDLCGRMHNFYGIVASTIQDNRVKVYIVPEAHGHALYANRRRIAIFLHARPQDIMETGDDLFVDVGNGRALRHFRNGLELVDVHIKQLNVPVTLHVSAVLKLRDKLILIDPGLWSKARVELRRFDRRRIEVGGKAKLTHGIVAGGIVTFLEEVPERGWGYFKVRIWVGPSVYHGVLHFAWTGASFEVGDEVLASIGNGETVSGFICSEEMQGCFLVYDPTSNLHHYVESRNVKYYDAADNVAYQ